ncbi:MULTISPECIES: GIY-YIG nuclease family protein [unclassified Paludibacterium]|uniref:GIY-YIG nuclease family protein n=1 Tax=unclassified Paludibacterium TaxID=2618429 RepID=UPI001C05B430|nr:GIY-YIG nuclease family protein [Paludibacterium sp. B53371]BEV72540.1 hypothetical protein THUN1379_20220 [Paludibacterium sp. THUN1379]
MDCKPVAARPWYLYVIACRGGSLYTGISTDVARRYQQHASGRGARYTRSHPPEKLLLSIEFPDRSEALKAEYAFKQLSAAEKRSFCLRHETASD